MKNAVIIVILLVILSFAAFYVYREKKRGKTCIGCPHSGACKSGDSRACTKHPDCRRGSTQK